jgi:exopolysaccharide biosynthesis protein
MKRNAAVAVAVLVAAAWFVAAQETVATPWRAIGPGLEHAQLTRQEHAVGKAGPWNINLLRVDPARAQLEIVHARDNAVGLETLSALAARHGATAAINGGYFRMSGTFGGDSTGTLQINGKILSEPDRGRAAVGLVRTGQTTRVVMGHVGWEGRVDVEGRRRPLNGVNRPRGRNEVVLFTPEFSETTLTDSTGTEAVVRGGRVVEVRDNAGSTPIPRDGFILSTTGAARTWARRQLRQGRKVAVSLKLTSLDPAKPDLWSDAEDILGAGPMIVRGGRMDITAKREKMLPAFASDRHPRTAIASLSDGRVILAVVDGRQPASVGMSLEELARLLLEHGATNAMNLDGGGSTAMVVHGRVVNRPSDVMGERPVSDAILVMPTSQ